jgi:hypothetical protein
MAERPDSNLHPYESPPADRAAGWRRRILWKGDLLVMLLCSPIFLALLGVLIALLLPFLQRLRE